MAQISLKKLLKKETAALIEQIIQAIPTPIGIQDADAKMLFGDAASFAAGTHPVTLEDEILGWVGGAEQAASVAALLSHLASREVEKRALSHETLERYKEINLLYTISAKMASCLDPQEVAQLAIEEATKLITVSSASVMLLNPATNTLEIIAASGTAVFSNLVLHPGEGIAGNVFLTGQGVIFNDVHSTMEFIEGPHQVISIICTPLKVEEKIIGVMNLSHEQPVAYTAGELKLATSLASQAAVSIENTRLQVERLERQRIVQELEIARNIQQSLLPSSDPILEDAEVRGLSNPAKQVGGDFYDYIPFAQDRLGLVIADVSGKGVPAALFMALSRALMRANAMQDLPIAKVVYQTNAFIVENATAGMFVTLFYAIVDMYTRILTYVNAGHNLPILYRKSTGEVQFLEADGMALGVLDEIELEERKVTLQDGDVVVFYTDGVTDAVNMQEEDFGEERLVRLIQEHHALSADELIHKIEELVMTFAGEAPQFDDITLMVVKIGAADER